MTERAIPVRLTILEGRDAGRTRRFELDAASKIVLGRHDDCDIPVWDEAASRRHACIEIRDGVLEVVDLGSSNGTIVDGQRIDRLTVRGGERVRIGETELRIETEGFKRRETVVLPGAQYTVAGEVEARDVDVSSSIDASPRDRRRLDALLALVGAVQRARKGERVLAVLIEQAKEATLATSGFVVPSAEGSAELLWDDVVGHRASSTSTSVRDIAGRVAHDLRALRIVDTAEDPRTRDRESLVGRGSRSVVAAPIAGRGTVHGVLYIEGDASNEPIEDRDLSVVAKLAETAALALDGLARLERTEQLYRAESGRDDVTIDTHSDVLNERLRQLERFSASGGPVLIVGETGTGKELVARAAHRAGPYSSGPFVPVNCAAIPAALLESELFGYEKGAFTGAVGRKLGMFELAHHGTLFLDEIGDLPIELQPKLLRVLESGQFYRIGGRSPVSTELLVVSATHRDLSNRVEDGRFREDLLYRLDRFRTETLPLRERTEDIESLSRVFLEAAARRTADDVKSLSPSAVDALRRYHWPGNIRELRNVIERAAVIAIDPVIEFPDLGLAVTSEPATGSDSTTDVNASRSNNGPPPTIEAVEERAIREALEYTGGKKGEAAELLGISWPTLRRKLRKYEIDASDPL